MSSHYEVSHKGITLKIKKRTTRVNGKAYVNWEIREHTPDGLVRHKRANLQAARETAKEICEAIVSRKQDLVQMDPDVWGEVLRALEILPPKCLRIDSAAQIVLDSMRYVDADVIVEEPDQTGHAVSQRHQPAYRVRHHRPRSTRLGIRKIRGQSMMPRKNMRLTHASYFCYKENYRRNYNKAAHAASARKEQGMKVRTISVWVAALTMVSLSSSALAKEQVPIKGEFATEFRFSSPPPVASLTLSGSGLASHLGKATCFSGNEVVDFTQQPLPTLTGTLTLTAANGDTLTGEMDAIAIPAQDGSITFFGTLTITGGTGRFANAKGTAEFGGTGTPTSQFGGIGWFSFEGTVTSPGASKK